MNLLEFLDTLARSESSRVGIRNTGERRTTELSLTNEAIQQQASAVDLPYRPCVGIMLINRHGRVWTGRRRPKWVGDRSAHIWQMPQGGIDKGEDPLAAAFRELREETGIRNAELLARMPHWLSYDLPSNLLGVALKGRYRGQRQLWFAMRFTGEDGEVRISGTLGLKAEFDAWRWAEPHELGERIVTFKRPVYESVISEFSHLLR